MKAKVFRGSYWKTAEEEHARALQQAQDALNALTPNEVAKMRRLLMAWTRIADMTVSEFVGGVIDKRLEGETNETKLNEVNA